MRIWTEIAYCRDQSNKDLGFYYNDIVKKYQSDDYKNDWICLLDHDARFLNDKWYVILEYYIKKYGETYKLFSCRTNRVHNLEQKVSHLENEDRNTPHKKLADKLALTNYALSEASNLISGVLMLFPCHLDVKFRQLGTPLGVDNAFHNDVKQKGYKVGIMENLYVYHWYRFDTNNTNHLQ